MVVLLYYIVQYINKVNEHIGTPFKRKNILTAEIPYIYLCFILTDSLCLYHMYIQKLGIRTNPEYALMTQEPCPFLIFLEIILAEESV